MADKKEEKPEPKPRANIAYIGGDGWRPLTDVRSEGKRYKLPEDQSKPFHHGQADFIIRHYPHLYKRVTEKGVK